MANTLWTTSYQASGKAILAVAALAGIPLQLPAHYEHFVDNKKPEFLSKFPHGKIPALEQPDGFRIFESAAIIRYVAGLNPSVGLLGKNPQEAALINQWMHLSELEVDLYTNFSFQILRGSIAPYNKSVGQIILVSFHSADNFLVEQLHNFFIENQRRAIKTLNDHLSTRTFFVGERITLADIYIAAQIRRAATVTFDAPSRAEYRHITRHLETILNQPQFKDVFEPVEFVEKALQYVPPPKEKKEPSLPPPKVEKKPKETEADEEEPDVPPEPKVKNPFDDLPKSTFNLEDWKRQYSNNDTRGAGGSLEWFYKNFDAAGFSIWRVDFKYNEELTQTFMSSNQIGGFFNRLEASRKYLFGSVGVLGTANNSIITGVLVLRGLHAQPVVEVAPDWESYSYKKLDLSNEGDKEFFEAALAWDLQIDGKKWADGKNLK
ncbi:hypothetical protein C0992_005653 [Termitomyces sp. T32_za158]|nr:hypothetical protein C0992_005653 [Termitomyces sp. T32_za158]